MTRGYEPRWDIDREFGEQGEDSVRAVLRLKGADIEVKRKRMLDDSFYVETHQKPRGAEAYKSSGINTSPSQVWGFTIGDTGVTVLIPSSRLKAAARAFGIPKEERDGANPTKGRLVRFLDLLREPPAATADPAPGNLSEDELLERIADETFGAAIRKLNRKEAA